VKNEPRQVGADDYRVVMATFTMEQIPEIKQVNEIMGTPYSKNQKAIILLKFDSFKSEWIIVAFDTANQNAEFKTNNVSSSNTFAKPKMR